MGWLAAVLALALVSWLGWRLVEVDRQGQTLRMVKRRRSRPRRRKHHH